MRFWLAALVLVPVAFARAGGDTADSLAQDGLKILKEIKSLLATIKDQKTAEAARPKLLDLAKSYGKLFDRTGVILRDPVQSKRLAELNKKYGKEGEGLLKDVSREVKRVRELPGVLKALEDVSLIDLFDAPGARRARVRIDLRNLTTAVEAHKVRHGAFPASLKDLTKGKKGEKPLLEPKALRDPWGRPYVYDPSQLDPVTGRPLIYSEGPPPRNPSGRISNWTAPKKK
jgi:hypothetical protein